MWNWAVRSALVPIFWTSFWTALRAMVPRTNVFVTSCQNFPYSSGAPPTRVTRRMWGPVQPWLKALSMVRLMDAEMVIDTRNDEPELINARKWRARKCSTLHYHGMDHKAMRTRTYVLQKFRRTTLRFVCTEPSQFSARPWASVQEIKVATTKYGCTWTLPAINMLMSHEEIMSNVSSSKKGPALARLTKRKA